MKRISPTGTALPPRPSANGHIPAADQDPIGFPKEAIDREREKERQEKANREAEIARDAEKLFRARKSEEDERLASGIDARPVSRCGKPLRKEKILWVERLKGAMSGRYIIYSPDLWGYQTHYHGKRTVLCFENRALCQGGHKRSTLRDNYLLHCYSYQRKAQVFLYLTPGAALQLTEQLSPGLSLRGQLLFIQRTPQDKGRYAVRVEGLYEHLDKLPADLDPRPTLDNWFQVDPDDQAAISHLGPHPNPDFGQDE